MLSTTEVLQIIFQVLVSIFSQAFNTLWMWELTDHYTTVCLSLFLGVSRCRIRATTRPTVSSGPGRVGPEHLVLSSHHGSVLPRAAVEQPAAGDGAVYEPLLQVLPLRGMCRRSQEQVGVKSFSRANHSRDIFVLHYSPSRLLSTG